MHDTERNSRETRFGGKRSRLSRDEREQSRMHGYASLSEVISISLSRLSRRALSELFCAERIVDVMRGRVRL